jgi:hypothetical protein
VILGVVTMHASMTPGPQDTATPAMTATAMASLPEMPGVEHSPDPMPASHELLHLCLAVLAAAIALGLTAVAVTILTRRDHYTAAPCPREVVLVPPRPPPRTAVRLAQLCVLRN